MLLNKFEGGLFYKKDCYFYTDQVKSIIKYSKQIPKEPVRT